LKKNINSSNRLDKLMKSVLWVALLISIQVVFAMVLAFKPIIFDYFINYLAISIY
jgi:hypothetical protein